MKKHLFAALSFLFLFLTAFSPKTFAAQEADQADHRTISVEGAKTLLDHKKELVLVDVRTAEEYETSHIPGAIHIANEDISDTPPEQLDDFDTTIIVYCRSGRRSKESAEKLLALGYTDVRDMGGINDWPYDTVTGAETGTWDTDYNEDTPVGVLGSFTATDLNSSVVDESLLSDYNLTMVNVWATFCGPCLREMPDLGELAEEYESQGVQIVGLISDVLNSDGSISESQVSTAQAIVDSTGADYPHILPSEDLFPLLSVITSVPTTFFVDQNGDQVGNVYVGSKSKDDWKAIIDQTLKEVSE